MTRYDFRLTRYETRAILNHMSETNSKPRDRNRQNGQYTYEGNLERLCVCGETLGNHLAAAPHPGGTDYGMDHRLGVEECPKFKPAKGAALRRVCPCTNVITLDDGTTVCTVCEAVKP